MAVIHQFFDRIDLAKRNAEASARLNPASSCASGCILILSSLALFIIACVGAAGILPGSTVGWAVVGLTGGSVLITLAQGRLKEWKLTLLTQIALIIPIIIGILGITGVLSGTQVGWGVIGTTLVIGIPIGIAKQYRKATLADWQAKQKAAPPSGHWVTITV